MVLEQALKSSSEAVKGLGSAVRSQNHLICEGSRLGYSGPMSWLLISRLVRLGGVEVFRRSSLGFLFYCWLG